MKLSQKLRLVLVIMLLNLFSSCEKNEVLPENHHHTPYGTHPREIVDLTDQVVMLTDEDREEFKQYLFEEIGIDENARYLFPTIPKVRTVFRLYSGGRIYVLGNEAFKYVYAGRTYLWNQNYNVNFKNTTRLLTINSTWYQGTESIYDAEGFVIDSDSQGKFLLLSRANAADFDFYYDRRKVSAAASVMDETGRKGNFQLFYF
ncbi:hypothetical protein [Catalinimonas niigatensis]|uniref:hypothetical protein n=1 Tax=Catalinimonas niigatensis TaxID=1397264 RepID=UPI002665F628|nr:hypothetical protein [Catalinimonas niigatensis]WPP51766.1 hypothetical protein PZB72_05120 [Catalinimonas niigatensis]